MNTFWQHQYLKLKNAVFPPALMSMNYRQRPRLREEIRSLMRAIDNTTNPPKIPQLERIESLKAELIQHQKTMETMEVQVKKINTSHSSIPQIILNP